MPVIARFASLYASTHSTGSIIAARACFELHSPRLDTARLDPSRSHDRHIATARFAMLQLIPAVADRPLRVTCVGAHSDDAEIGCAATILAWLAANPRLEVTWVVLSAEGPRADEARRSAEGLLGAATASRIVIGDFRDCYLQSQYADVKDFFEALKESGEPDIVFTHRLEDRHQDHRLVAEMTWNTWRSHLVLEYEVPKYEGDLSTPNVYVPVPGAVARRKAEHLERHFASQRAKDWFGAETFLSLMRIRGLECRSESGFAEGFHARKLSLAAPS
jgi:LmbE family N-acetylglucosaminyl deacetylase